MILSNPILCANPPPPRNLILNPNPCSASSRLPFLSRRSLQRRCRRSDESKWDSNAESFRFRFRDGDGESGESRNGARRWWSDVVEDELDDGFVLFGEESESFWDKLWIFKVFKAYGYLLPALVASMLLGTGPQAFLMALALPLGQSAISLAIEKLWGGVSKGPGAKPRTKRKPFSQSSTNFRKQEEDETSSDYKGRGGYQSWVSADPKVTNRANRSRSSFGGWDEFDKQKESMRKNSPADRVKRGKLSRRGRYRDVPLFLRLLIAVFPFLGSWTRIL